MFTSFGPLLVAALPAYLLGAIPFGYLVARSRGVDLFQVGSGNIGATNVGRVLGLRYGLLVFVLDFLKGAIPAALAQAWLGPLGGVVAGLTAFLGHLFPIYLGFRGGKGVATGAGVIAVVLPVPFAASLAAWLALVAASRFISVASVGAALVLAITQLVRELSWSSPLTAFAVIAATLVIVRHISNLRRLVAGTESRLPESATMTTLTRTLHILALALWFGGSAFFIFSAAIVFDSFKQVVRSEPGPRTANVAIAASVSGDDARLTQLANALAGAAVGPLFTPYFVTQTACGLIALVTALAWWRSPGRGVDRARVLVLGLALLTIAIGWPLANYVGELRELRYAADAATAEAAKAAFGSWHTVSLLLSFVTLGLVLTATLLAGSLPEGKSRAVGTT